ncbi:MAG TPA: hypothetical protein VHP37_11995 [Burkholderiales bacterium]|nr:hypothetical protein [Burkholderiales bacterium]
MKTLIACVLFLLAAGAQAQGVAPSQNRVDLKTADETAIAYKLTPSFYHTSSQPDAYDVNLRGNLSTHTAWIGYYQQAGEFRQLRLGYEDTIALPFGHLTPSLQYATRGFLGGSVNAEIGERWFGLLGFGRTNLKDYFNLNFDPNDAILFGFGTRAIPRTVLSAYEIKDDRLHTGQRIAHVVARIKPDERTRLTIDVFHKNGRASAEDEIRVRGTGVSVTLDYDRYFVRVASDPHVNFTADHMVRVSLGLHF